MRPMPNDRVERMITYAYECGDSQPELHPVGENQVSRAIKVCLKPFN